jgi:hypothetical protein
MLQREEAGKGLTGFFSPEDLNTGWGTKSVFVFVFLTGITYVDPGLFARFIKLPACAIRRAPTNSPTSAVTDER